MWSPREYQDEYDEAYDELTHFKYEDEEDEEALYFDCPMQHRMSYLKQSCQEEFLKEHYTNKKEYKVMKSSETISKLAMALCKAQGEISPAKKDANNPFFKSKYADLESVWEACREVLAKHEISIVQCPQIHEGEVCLETVMMHSSGEWIKSVLPLMVKESNPQALGTAITYARRYSLAAMVGVVQTDDDAESAMNRGNGKKADAQPSKEISFHEAKKVVKVAIGIPKEEFFAEYYNFVKSKVKKPMAEVINGWLENPQSFKDHYEAWTSKKIIDKNGGETYKGDNQGTLLEDHG